MEAIFGSGTVKLQVVVWAGSPDIDMHTVTDAHTAKPVLVDITNQSLVEIGTQEHVHLAGRAPAAIT